MSRESAILDRCLGLRGADPIRAAIAMMHDLPIRMHGPEHHFLVPGVLLGVALANNGLGVDAIRQRLREARERALQVPGGFCGSHGACGAGVGAGIFFSILTGATPLSEDEWKWSQAATARSLAAMARIGGPRCCKRSTYLALRASILLARRLRVADFPYPPRIVCGFSGMNEECIGASCPFNPRGLESAAVTSPA